MKLGQDDIKDSFGGIFFLKNSFMYNFMRLLSKMNKFFNVILPMINIKEEAGFCIK